MDAFFTKIILDIIVIETNQKIKKAMVQLQSMLAADSSSRYGVYTTDQSFESIGTDWNDLNARFTRTSASKH